MSELGDGIRKARINKELSQDELAGKVGVTQAAISQFEKGQRLPTPANLKKIAAACDVVVEDLAGGDRADFERTILMRNLRGLPPEKISEINRIVETYRQAYQSDRKKAGRMTEQAISACAAELRENLGISPTDAIGDIQQAVANGGIRIPRGTIRGSVLRVFRLD